MEHYKHYKIIWVILAIIIISINIFTIYLTEERHYISIFNAWMLSLIILLILPVLYIFFFKRIEQQMEENMYTISHLLTAQNNDSRNNKPTKLIRTIFYRFLDYDEKKIIEKLIEKNGVILQSELIRLTNMNKVKIHRTLQDMRQREIISIERYGKTNRIQLAEDVKRFFLDTAPP
jgi:predicted transcriptional regulator